MSNISFPSPHRWRIKGRMSIADPHRSAFIARWGSNGLHAWLQLSPSYRTASQITSDHMASSRSSRTTSVSSKASARSALSQTGASAASRRSVSSLNSPEYGLSKDDPFNSDPRRPARGVSQVRYERLGRITAIAVQGDRQVFKVRGDFEKSTGIHLRSASAKDCKIEYTLPISAVTGLSRILGPIEGVLIYTSTNTNECITEEELRYRRTPLHQARNQRRSSEQQQQQKLAITEKPGRQPTQVRPTNSTRSDSKRSRNPHIQSVGAWLEVSDNLSMLSYEVELRSGGYKILRPSEWQGLLPDGFLCPVYQDMATGKYMTRATALELGAKLDRWFGASLAD